MKKLKNKIIKNIHSMINELRVKNINLIDIIEKKYKETAEISKNYLTKKIKNQFNKNINFEDLNKDIREFKSNSFKENFLIIPNYITYQLNNHIGFYFEKFNFLHFDTGNINNFEKFYKIQAKYLEKICSDKILLKNLIAIKYTYKLNKINNFFFKITDDFYILDWFLQKNGIQKRYFYLINTSNIFFGLFVNSNEKINSKNLFEYNLYLRLKQVEELLFYTKMLQNNKKNYFFVTIDEYFLDKLKIIKNFIINTKIINENKFSLFDLRNIQGFLNFLKNIDIDKINNENINFINDFINKLEKE